MPTQQSTAVSGPSVHPRQHAERLRQKRRQVARACEACRVHRVRCDDNQPCSQCKSRGQRCSNRNIATTPTLAGAHDQIAQLRQKVQELELKLAQERSKTSVSPSQPPSTPLCSSSSPYQDFHLGDLYPDHNREYKKQVWEGVQLRPTRALHDTWFGPSSLYFFIKRLSLSLSAFFRHPQSVDRMLLNSASSRNLLDGPTAPREEKSTASGVEATSDDAVAELSPIQEEYFLNFFWESYHTSLYAVLDETEFKKQYLSLWTSGKARKPSALVDIVLAMSIQYAISKLPQGLQEGNVESTDATIAGQWHYRRCQRLLTYEMESPTIGTLQCHLLCAIYLCGGSYHNMVDISCGLAVRTAYMLGLHLDPPPTMSVREREARRRLWWSVYVLDSKTGMKLGRPFLLHESHAMPHLPGDNLEIATLSGSTFAPIGDNVTWLSFNLHHAKLFKVVRAAHTAFYDRDINLHDDQMIWDDAQALEASAQLLLPHTKFLQAWIDEVPDALKTKRQNKGCPLSTDGSALEIEQFAPL
jgi:hypothetical protein